VGTAPLIVVAGLTPTARLFDAEFIADVNAIFLLKRSNTLPAFLRFDLMDPVLLSEDGLHPSSAGYDVLSMLADEYIHDDAQERAKAARVDVDDDGIFDAFEKLKYGTSPSLSDTDGDGLKDGAEVFRHKTNPLLADTDGDGMIDRQEILQGTDPRVPSSGPPPATPTPAEEPTGTPTAAPTATVTPAPTSTPTATASPTPSS
jgi:hypothetical protein